MNKIREAKEKLKAQFKKIEEKGENVEYNDLNAIEKIISKDNTEPMFIIFYLQLIEKFEKDKYDEKIKKYLPFLSIEDINKHFPSYLNLKTDSSKLFEILFDKIKSFKRDWFLMLKINYFNELSDFKNDDIIIKGVLEYSSNKNLFLYNLFRRIINGIIQHINTFKNFKPTENDFLIKMLEKEIKEANVYLKAEKLKSNNLNLEEILSKEEQDIYKRLINKEDYDANKAIKESEKKIELINKINTKDFTLYFTHFKEFLKETKKNFDLRFKNINNLEQKDISLFIDFCFFLESYNFERDLTKFYIDKWNDTFCQTKESIKKITEKNSKAKMLEYQLIDKDMAIIKYDHSEQIKDITYIKNIEKYSINCVINHFQQKIHISEENSIQYNTNEYKEIKTYIDYSTEKFLKFDSNEELYINKIWGFYEDYLVQIFTSKAMKTAVEQMFADLKINNCYDLLNADDIKGILQRSKFYGFESNNFGFTDPLLLIDFAYYKGLIESYGEEISKLFNFCLYQIIQEHEILGHIEIGMQDYILEQEVKSPKLDYIDMSDTNKIVKDYESGEYIERLLYGESIQQLSYNKILFLLDVENYNVNYNEFRENFQKCDKSVYKKSESLEQFLAKIKIKLEPKYCGFLPIMINRGLVGKSMQNNNLFLYQRKHTHLHPSNDDNNILKLIIDDIKKYKLLKKFNY